MNSSCSTTDRRGAAAETTANATTTITTVHPDIIQEHILNRLDGPTLASASCASSSLNNLCSDENLWKKICDASWPSTTDPLLQTTISTFPSGHRSFFSDASSAAVHHHHHQPSNMSRLISAVDIHFDENLICSRVIVTDTSTSWFESTPFRIDLLEQKEIVPTPVKLAGDEISGVSDIEGRMRLSWVLIDPDSKRAFNVSSMSPVEVRRHWLTEEIQVKYSTVMNSGGSSNDADGTCQLGQHVIVVTCGETERGELHVREVKLQVEDIEGKVLRGRDILVILQGAMRADRKMKRGEEEKARYEMFMELKKDLRERNQRKERRLDMMCVATGIFIFVSFWTFILM